MDHEWTVTVLTGKEHDAQEECPLGLTQLRKVVLTLRLYPKETKIQTTYLRLLTTPVDSEAVKAVWTKEGVADAALEAMRNHPLNATVQDLACSVMWNSLNVEDENKMISLMEDKGATALILLAMRRFVDNPELQLRAIAALKCLSGSQKKATLVLLKQATVIKTVFAAMRAFPYEVGVQGNGCQILYDFILSGGIAEQEVIEREGHKLIIEAMRQHPSFYTIQEFGCRSIYTFGEAGDKISDTMLSQGLGEVLLRALETAPDEDLAKEALCALEKLALMSKDCKSKLIEFGAVKIVVKTMIAFKEDVVIQICALAIISKLAAVETWSLIDQNLGEAVLGAILTHSNSLQLADMALKFLAGFVVRKNGDDYKTYLIDIGVVESVIMMTRSKKLRKPQLDVACEMLCAFSTVEDHHIKLRLVEVGLATYFIEVGDANQMEFRLRQWCLLGLSSLICSRSVTPSQSLQTIDSTPGFGSFGSLIHILKAFPESFEVQTRCSMAIYRFLLNADDMAKKFYCRNGVRRVLEEAMEQHIDKYGKLHKYCTSSIELLSSTNILSDEREEF